MIRHVSLNSYSVLGSTHGMKTAVISLTTLSKGRVVLCPIRARSLQCISKRADMLLIPAATAVPAHLSIIYYGRVFGTEAVAAGGR